MTRIQAILIVLLTCLFTTYGQVIFKWRALEAGPMPSVLNEKLLYLLKIFTSPWVLSAILSAFLASVCWMIAITKLPLSYAYPFTSLSFILVMVASSLFFHEAISPPKIIGLSLIVSGIILIGFQE
jgi:multidrug transporter EmrE-like cation transporter